MENVSEQAQTLAPQTGAPSDMSGSELVQRKYLTKKDYVFFSLAQFASSAITGLVQGYLLFYYTVCMGISTTAVGTMFLVSKIFDALNDPIMGVIVDKTRSKWGKMRPYLLFGSIPWGIISILLFVPVTGLNMTGKIVFMYVSYLAYTVMGTLVGVPLGGIPAVASPNTQERTRLISISRILGSIGEQSALVLISLGLLLSNNYRSVYLIVAIIIGTLGTLFMVLGGQIIKERLEPTVDRPKMTDGFKYLFQNKQFLLLILSNLLTFFRNLVSAAIIYVVTYIFSNGSLQIWFALPGAVASMIGMLLAPKLKTKMDAKQLFIFATIWHSVALALVWFIYSVGGNQWYTIAAAMFVAMLPVGILNVVPHLMATDTIDYWEEKTGQRCEGITFALMSLRSKVSSAFKDYFLAWLLAFFMFSQPLSFLKSHEPVQSEFTKTGLFLIYTLIPAALNLISIVPMLFYKLSGKRMAEIQGRLALRREEEAAQADGDAVRDSVADADAQATPQATVSGEMQTAQVEMTAQTQPEPNKTDEGGQAE